MLSPLQSSLLAYFVAAGIYCAGATPDNEPWFYFWGAGYGE